VGVRRRISRLVLVALKGSPVQLLSGEKHSRNSSEGVNGKKKGRRHNTVINTPKDAHKYKKRERHSLNIEKDSTVKYRRRKGKTWGKAKARGWLIT